MDPYLSFLDKTSKEYILLRNQIPFFEFKKTSSKKSYVMDIPPRYTSGELHLGHAIGYTTVDMVGRAKLKLGYNVFAPLCFDTNGMPIEIKLEKEGFDPKNKENFIKECLFFSEKQIKKMEKQFLNLHCFFDKKNKYLTGEPRFQRLTQENFLELFSKNKIFSKETNLNYCPSCKTVLSKGELEPKKKNKKIFKLNFLDLEFFCFQEFDLKGGLVLFNSSLNKTTETRLKKEGIVFEKESSLPFSNFIRSGSELKELYDKTTKKDFKNETTKTFSCYKEIEVPCCWRCSSEIKQTFKTAFFLDITSPDLKKNVLENIEKVKWISSSNKDKEFLKQWILDLKEDWVLSRQRIFATRLPLVTCELCKKVLPSKQKCCKKEPISPEVFDTWMDSSLTYLFLEKKTKQTVDIRFQSVDILRTWACYSFFKKEHASSGAVPWKKLYLTPYIFNKDGEAMHSSQNNTSAPEELSKEYGPETIRFVSASLTPGKNTALSQELLQEGLSLQKKIINCSKFLEKNFPTIVQNNLDGLFLKLLNFKKKKLKQALENENLSSFSQDLKTFLLLYSKSYLERKKETSLYSIFLFQELLNFFSIIFPALCWKLNKIFSPKEDLDKKEFFFSSKEQELTEEEEEEITLFLLSLQRLPTKLKSLELNLSCWPHISKQKVFFSKALNFNLEHCSDLEPLLENEKKNQNKLKTKERKKLKKISSSEEKKFFKAIVV